VRDSRCTQFHFTGRKPPRVRDPHIGDRDHLAAGPDLLGLRIAAFVSAFLVLDGHAEEIAMIDTDIIVAAVARRSAFDRPAASVRDRDADDLGRLAASLDYLTMCCRKPAADKAGQHLPLEAVADDEQLFVGAMPAR